VTYDVSDPLGNKAVTVNRKVNVYKTTSGINETDAANGFSIYPVPTSGMLTIDATAGRQVRSVKVYNVLGEEISSVNNDVRNATLKLDLTGKQPGMYILKIDTDKGAFTKKINVVR
jgi:uncharacterized membrane protein